MRVRPAAMAVVLVIGVGCGADDADTEAATPTIEATTTTEADTTTTERPRSTTTTTRYQMPAETAASVVDGVYGDPERAEDFRDILLTSIPQLEAVEKLAYDADQRQFYAVVFSTYEANEDVIAGLAYEIAQGFAQIWQETRGPLEDQGLDPADLLPSWRLELDGRTFVCEAGQMMALAEQRIGRETFVSDCRR